MELGHILQGLKEMSLADAQNESKSDVDAMQNVFVEKVMLLLQSSSLDTDVRAQMMNDIFRFLRNFVAGSKPRQLAVIRNPSFNIILTCIADLTTKVCGTTEKPSTSCQRELLQLRLAVQFLGNLIAGNIDNKMAIWKTIVWQFSYWLRSADKDLTRYAAMVLYNAILDVTSHRDELLSSEDSVKITVSLLESGSAGCEWALFALDNFLESDQFMESCYPEVPIDLRVSLLDVLSQKLSRTSCPFIPSQTLKFVMKEFESTSEKISTTSDGFIADDMSTLLATKYLEILCEASTKPPYQEHLQTSSSLLHSVVHLLRRVHLAGMQSTNKDYSLDTVAAPTWHLKSNLIRLIANQCWRHLGIQDMVREQDGIPLLLDCCKPNAQRPFIMQWVIFAIRNLCEGNLKNQEVIRQMKLQSAVEPTLLNHIYGPSDESSDTVSAMPSTSRSEQINDDIRDLMQ